jgi:hypothetical protein
MGVNAQRRAHARFMLNRSQHSEASEGYRSRKREALTNEVQSNTANPLFDSAWDFLEGRLPIAIDRVHNGVTKR